MNANTIKIKDPFQPHEQKRVRRNFLSITRCFRVPKGLSEQIDEIADLAQIHPSVFMRRAISRYIKHCQSQPQELEEIS